MNIRQQYIAKSKYARYLDHKGRRENWQETVSRYMGFMVKKLQERGYEMPLEEITELYEGILNQEVMPSMRLLMTAGPAAERSNIAIYNCSFLRIDDQKSFDEAMYILLNGVGVGFSVEQEAVNKLPEVPVQLFDSETTVVVADSKEGWAKALRQVIALLYSGEIPRWDLSKVRARGKRLKTFGGRASGPEVLDQLFRFLVKVFKGAVGRKLSSLECHDVVCKIAEVVVFGGTRRSALLSASDLHDDKMRHAKAGNWWDTNPERGLANNSAVYVSKPSVTEFMDEWKSLILSGSGERGIFNRKGAEQHALKADRKLKPGSGLNPCAEILLNNYQFCNLSTIVVKPTDSKEDLMRKIRLAALLGTYQATLTDFKYLRPCWKKQTEEETLLGVSMTGILDHPLLRQVSEETAAFLQQLRDEAVRVNKEYAQAFGINPAASVTSIKPEGCQNVDTLLSTDLGVLKLSELGGDPHTCSFQAIQSMKVSTDSEDQRVASFKGNGIAATKKIVLNSGLFLEATPNHMFRVVREGAYVWVRSDEIKEGDVVPYKLGSYNKQTDAVLHKDVVKTYNARQIKFPETVNEDLAWWLGVYTGDGSNHPKGIRIHCNINDLDHVNKILRIGKDQFGLEGRVEFKKHVNTAVVYFSSTTLLKWLGRNNLLKGKSLQIEIPLAVRTSSVRSLRSFLDGYNAADGCTHPAGMTWCTVSYKMASQVVVCLRALGKDASMYLMPPTATSKGNNVRYFVYERKGLDGNWKYTNKANDIRSLKQLGLEGFLADRVVSVENSYCLTADISVPVNNTYIANGYVSHNTVSQLCNTASGIHPNYSEYYIRSYRQDNKDPLTDLMKQAGVKWEPADKREDTTTVFYFPVKAPEGAFTRDQMSALEHLELWLQYRRHFTQHNPSITVNVKPDEWLEVGAWVYRHFDEVVGVSFLPWHDEDHTYRQLPFQACTKEQYEELLAQTPESIDWDSLIEYDDNVEGVQTLACTSGYCEQ